MPRYSGSGVVYNSPHVTYNGVPTVGFVNLVCGVLVSPPSKGGFRPSLPGVRYKRGKIYKTKAIEGLIYSEGSVVVRVSASCVVEGALLSGISGKLSFKGASVERSSGFIPIQGAIVTRAYEKFAVEGSTLIGFSGIWDCKGTVDVLSGGIRVMGTRDLFPVYVALGMMDFERR